MDLLYLLQLIIIGITEGSIYVLVALGIIMIYKCTKVVNLAQGEFVVLGGLVFASLSKQGLSLPISFILTIVIVGFIIGGVVGIFGFRPFLRKNIHPGTIIIATIGLDMLIKMIIIYIWGKLPISVPYFSGDTPLKFAGISIYPQHIWVIAITIIAFIAVMLFLERTLLGKVFRACAENRFHARLFGINDSNMILVALIISAILGAVGGAVISPISYAKYDFGIMYSVNGFIAAVIGGMEKPMGALYGGMLIGILSSLSAGLLGGGIRDVLVVSAMLLILVIKPTGLYAGHAGGVE